MTAGGILGGGAGYQYESPTMRALGKITPESYDYRDQTKMMTKLIGDVSLMGGQMRKMQKGIDSANQNFIQQIQSLLNDFLVLLGGGGDTGLDFGDLRYVLQAIGALFGFTPDSEGNINPFTAAWHFFSNYIVPVGDFEEVINQIVDNLIATVLDLFGEVPIVGQALQQLAVVITEIRDLLLPIIDAVEALLGAFSFNVGDIESIGDFFGPLKPIFEAIMEALDEIDLPDFSETFRVLIQMGKPLVELVVAGIGVVAGFIKLITGQISLSGFGDLIYSFTQMITGSSGLSIINIGVGIIETFLNPTGLLAFLTGGLLDGSWIPHLDATILTGILDLARLPVQVLTTIGGVASSLINGVLGLGNIPTLPQGKISDLIDDLAEKLTSFSNIDATKLTGLIDLLRIPAVPQSKITNLATDLAAKLSAASNLDATKLINLINVARIPTGIPQANISSLITDLAARLTNASNIDATKLTGLIDLLRLPAVPQSKITDLVTDLADRLTAASSLNAANLSNIVNIPAIAQSKITNLLTDLAARLTSASNIDATKLTGLIDLLRLPTGIPQANIFSLASDLAARLTAASNLDATKLINTIAEARIPTLAQSKITSLITDLAARLTSASNIDATKLTGLIDLLRLPTGIPQANISSLASDLAARLTAASDLDAANITNLTNIGAIAQSKITSLVADLAARLTSSSNIDATKLTGIINLLRIPTGIPQASISSLVSDLSAKLTSASSLNATNLINTIATARLPTGIPQANIATLVSDLAAKLTSSSNIDATKLTGLIDLLRFPAIPKSKVTDLENNLIDITDTATSTIDAIINGLLNTPGEVGQSAAAIEDAIFRWPTDVFNILAGNTASRASVDEAKQALTTLQSTISSHTSAISSMQAALEESNGFRDIVTFKQAETITFSTPGAFAYDVPAWAQEIDRITLPPAGGGMGGNQFIPIHGEGGDASTWTSETLVKGTDFLTGTTQLTGTIGNRGAGGGVNGPGGAGGNIVHNSISGGKVGFTANGSAGGNIQDNSQAQGDSPGDLLYKGNLYAGGIGGASVSGQTGHPGGPGAGGGGGAGGTYLVGWPGGPGGIGKVSFCARAAMPSSLTSMGTLILPAYRLNTGVANTDSMTAAAAWSKVPPNGAAGGGIVFIRANTACTYYVFLRVWYVGTTTFYSIGRVSSGTMSVWKSGTIGEAIPFNAFSISSDDDYTFTVSVNGSAFDSYTDSGHTSTKGASYRNGGFQTSDATSPGSIIQFALFDSGIPSRITTAEVDTAQSTTTHGTYINLATVGPSVTIDVPDSGEVTVILSADILCNTNILAYMGFEISGANTDSASDVKSLHSQGVPVYSGNFGMSRFFHLRGLNPGTTTFTAKYKTSAATGTFSNRSLTVDPKP